MPLILNFDLLIVSLSANIPMHTQIGLSVLTCGGQSFDLALIYALHMLFL